MPTMLASASRCPLAALPRLHACGTPLAPAARHECCQPVTILPVQHVPVGSPAKCAASVCCTQSTLAKGLWTVVGCGAGRC
jgi:hypothetical protein